MIIYLVFFNTNSVNIILTIMPEYDGDDGGCMPTDDNDGGLL